MSELKSKKTATGDRAPRVFGIFAKIIFWLAVLVVFIHFTLRLYPLIDPASPAVPPRLDFTVFWAAGKLAFDGHPLAAFDPHAILAAAGLPDEAAPTSAFLWLYPAGFLVALMPLGALPYPLAILVYVAVSIGALALALRAPALAFPGLTRLILAAPVIVIGSVMIGQVSALWTAGLIAALWAMRGGNAVASGLCIALLTMKPQLGLLIPVALIAARQWAVIGWATGFTALLTSAATILTGPEYWSLFFGALDNLAGLVADGALMKLHLMSSFYSFLRALGAAHDTALSSQLAVTAALAMVTGWVWSRPGLGFDLKCATLCAAIPLATPYAFYYVLTIELAAALFLIRDGFGRSLLAKTWLLVVWLGPAPAFVFPAQLSAALYGPTILFVTLAICLTRVRAHTAAESAGIPAKPPVPVNSTRL